MNIQEIIKSKEIKGKEKTEIISKGLLDNVYPIAELLEYARSAKAPEKACCIESIEYATKIKPEIASVDVFEFVCEALSDKAPRVKWESARVIGNTARLFPSKLDVAINKLLINSEDAGTVVRWSAAFALGEILKLKTEYNKNLIPAFEAIIEREEKNSIRKIYMEAIKKSKIK